MMRTFTALLVALFVTLAGCSSGTAKMETSSKTTTSTKESGFVVSVKDVKPLSGITTKECYGAVGCNVAFWVSAVYTGSQPLPDTGTLIVSIVVHGMETNLTVDVSLVAGKDTSPFVGAGRTKSSEDKVWAEAKDVVWKEQ